MNPSLAVRGASIHVARHHAAQRGQRRKDPNRAAAHTLLAGMAFGEAERAVNEHPDDAICRSSTPRKRKWRE
jgi:hypothetical protein